MSNTLQSYTQNILKCRFAVYKITYSEDKRFVRRYFIVLKDDLTGLIIKVTDFADYVLYRAMEDMNAYRTNESACDLSVFKLCVF